MKSPHLLAGEVQELPRLRRRNLWRTLGRIFLVSVSVGAIVGALTYGVAHLVVRLTGGAS